jgi:hypothetical protein
MDWTYDKKKEWEWQKETHWTRNLKGIEGSRGTCGGSSKGGGGRGSKEWNEVG